MIARVIRGESKNQSDRNAAPSYTMSRIFGRSQSSYQATTISLGHSASEDIETPSKIDSPLNSLTSDERR